MSLLLIYVLTLCFVRSTGSSVCGLSPTSCPDGWTKKDYQEGSTWLSRCYKMHQPAVVSTHADAIALCATEEATLLRNIDSTTIWWLASEGLTFTGSVWLDLNYDGSQWLWADGTQVSAPNWGESEPLLEEGGAVVTMMDDGFWYAVSDTTTATNVICQQPGVCKMSQLDVAQRKYDISLIEEFQDEGTELDIPCEEGFTTTGGEKIVKFTCGSDSLKGRCAQCNVQVTCDIPSDFWSSNSLDTPSDAPSPLMYGNTITVSCVEGYETEDCSTKQSLDCLADGSIAVNPCQSSHCCFLNTLNFWELGIAWPSDWTLIKGEYMELTCSGSNYLPQCTTSQYVICHDKDGDGVPQLSEPVKCTCKRCNGEPAPCMPPLCLNRR